MIMLPWDTIPSSLQNEEVHQYYRILEKKKVYLLVKRWTDVLLASLLLLLLFPLFIVLAILIKLDSCGPVFFRQERVTQWGRHFRIFKFRTMVANAEKLGTQVTVNQDARITRVGKYIRKCRLDEMPQLLNVLWGSMTFVGTRPEVPKYVSQYSDEMLATLLLPAGITSRASLEFKDEDTILNGDIDVDKAYIQKVLPLKMKLNLQAIRDFSLLEDLNIMVMTFRKVMLP